MLFNIVGKNADGTQRVKGTNTCHWINKSQVPNGKKSYFYVSQTMGETNPNNLVISVLDIGKGCYSLP
jgi:hypothetical protein